MRAPGILLALLCVASACSRAPTAPPPSDAGAAAVALVLEGKVYDPETGAILRPARPDEPTWPTPRSSIDRGVADAQAVTIKGDEALLHAHPLDDGFVVSTNKRVARLDARGQARWELPAMKDTFVGAGGTVVLPGGDLLVYGYGAISDSGVELLRVHLDNGAVVFRVHSSGLNVDHSEYEHAAYVRLRGDHLDVASIGSYGTFVDVTDALTGKTIKRWQPTTRRGGGP